MSTKLCDLLPNLVSYLTPTTCGLKSDIVLTRISVMVDKNPDSPKKKRPGRTGFSTYTEPMARSHLLRLTAISQELELVVAGIKRAAARGEEVAAAIQHFNNGMAWLDHFIGHVRLKLDRVTPSNERDYYPPLRTEGGIHELPDLVFPPRKNHKQSPKTRHHR